MTLRLTHGFIAFRSQYHQKLPVVDVEYVLDTIQSTGFSGMEPRIRSFGAKLRHAIIEMSIAERDVQQYPPEALNIAHLESVSNVFLFSTETSNPICHLERAAVTAVRRDAQYLRVTFEGFLS